MLATDQRRVFISLIVAMAENRAIGADNALPWHLPADLHHFRELTIGKVVVMGRKTHESIGRPLPHRKNLVLSRDPHYQAAGCTVVSSLDEACALVPPGEELMVMGGASIYAQAMPRARRIYLTEVHHSVAADTFFPPLHASQWQETARSSHPADTDNPHAFSFVVLERLGPAG